MPKRRQKQPRQPPQGEQPDEAQGVQHRRFERDLGLVERGGPVEHLDGRGNRHEEAEERKDDAGINRLPRHEHVVSPHQKAEDRDGKAGIADERVAKRTPPRKTGDDLADHPQPRQHHDVNRRMRIEPEQMLEQDRVAPQLGIENADAQAALHENQQQRHRQHRRGQHHDQAGGIDRPQKQRQPRPRQPGRPHAVNRDDEVQAGQNRRKAGNENAGGGRHDVRIGVDGAERGIKRPARVDAPPNDRIQREQSAGDVDVPTGQVQLAERRRRGRRSSAARKNCPARWESTARGRKKSSRCRAS